MVYNAVFIAYFLLSTFNKIGEKERLSVELVVNLAASYVSLHVSFSFQPWLMHTG